MNSSNNGSLSLDGSALDSAIANAGGGEDQGQEQDFAPPGTVAFQRQMEDLNDQAQGGSGRRRTAREVTDAAGSDGRTRQRTRLNADYSRPTADADDGRGEDRPSADDVYDDDAGTELAAGRDARAPQRPGAGGDQQQADPAKKFLSQFGIGDADSDEALDQAAEDFQEALGQFDQLSDQQGDDGAGYDQQGQFAGGGQPGFGPAPWMQNPYGQQPPYPYGPQAPWAQQQGQPFGAPPWGQPPAPWMPQQPGPFGQQAPWMQGVQQAPPPALIDDDTLEAVGESGGKDVAKALRRFNEAAKQQHQALQTMQQQLAYQQWQAYQAQQQRQPQQPRQGQPRRGPSPQDAAKIYDAVFDQLTDFADVLGHSARGLSPQLKALRKELASNAARVQYVKRQSGVRYSDETAIKQAVIAYVRANAAGGGGGGGGSGDGKRDQRIQSRHRQRDISASRGARGAGGGDSTMSEVLSATREFLHGQRGG